MSEIAPGNPVEYHVLKEGAMFGPLTEEELRAGVVEGHYAWGDFVQVEGEVVWQSVARVLNASEKDFKEALPPDWTCLLRWALARLRYDLKQHGVLMAVTGLILGTLSLVLAAWPLVFWLPWFVGTAVVAAVLFRRQRPGPAALILLATIGIPLLILKFGPPAAREKAERAAREQRGFSEKAALPEPKAAPAPARETAPVTAAKSPEAAGVAPVAIATELAATPAPVALATVQPHYAPAPAEAIEAKPAETAPAAGSILSSASKLASSVVPFLVEKSKSALPSLAGSTPAEDAAATVPPAASNVLQSHSDAFVIVKGTNGAGSGFICRLAGKTWLFSNIHVVAEIKQPVIEKLNGNVIPLGAAEVAAGPDIARMVLAQEPEHPLEAITGFEENVHIGDAVAVLGNTGGGGVVTWLQGRVVGIGADRVEVSAMFIPGNSGSPIIHLKTGKVIGIASYLTRRYEQFAGDAGNGAFVVRRFGYRIDKVPAWEPVDWAELHAEADQIEQVSKLTTDIFNFLDSTRNQKDPAFITDTLRRPAQEWAAKLRVRNLSYPDRRSAAQGFLNALRFMVKVDIPPAEARIHYTYFRARLKEEAKVRERLFQAFDSELAKLDSSPGEH